MPPSGYSREQGQFFTDALRSCALALRTEGVGAGLTPMQALQREMSSIDGYLALCDQDRAMSQIEGSLLTLTRGYYDLILARDPADWVEFDDVSTSMCDMVARRIQAIKVEPRTREGL